MEYLNYILAIYAVVGLLVGLASFRQLRSVSRNKRNAACILFVILWPLVFGLFIMMLIDDAREYFTDSDYDEED